MWKYLGWWIDWAHRHHFVSCLKVIGGSEEMLRKVNEWMTGEREKRRHHQWKWDDTWLTSSKFECAASRDLFSCAWLTVVLLLSCFARSFRFNDLIIFAFLCKCFIWKWHFQDLSSRHPSSIVYSNSNPVSKNNRASVESSKEFTVPGSFPKHSKSSQTFVSLNWVMRSPSEGYLDANPSLIHTHTLTFTCGNYSFYFASTTKRTSKLITILHNIFFTL